MPAEHDFLPLLDHWFGALKGGFADADRRKKWFAGGPAFDAELTSKFATLVQAGLRGELDAWRSGNQRARLAYVLVCDQLTRNIYRGQAAAFAGDDRALAAAREAVASGQDLALGHDERVFLYMPFEHSENLVDQHTCVGLFTELLEQSPPEQRERISGFLRYAQEHREIIRQFGRFPHRNEVLGRASSVEELQFIAEGRGFGQTSSATATSGFVYTSRPT